MKKTGDQRSVAVVHPNLSRGGSGAVCLHVLEVLADHYDVTLVTDTEPDMAMLNEFFGTDMTGVNVRTLGVTGSFVDAAADLCSLVGTVGFDRLRKAVLTRFLAGTNEYDLVISTKNELSIPAAQIQYIHTPKWNRTAVPGLLGSENPVQPFYDAFCNWVSGFDSETVTDATLLSNSEWTADIVEDVYGVRPRVVYPPVDTTGFDSRPWTEREPGFVTIGRLAPNKNVEDAIEIVSNLHDRHPEVHLHLIGRATHPEYRDQILAEIEQHDYVHYEGTVPRDKLLEFISSHRFGLHTRPHESFGIVVAELVAGGTVPFLPSTGAPPEIINEREELLFDSTTAAVEKISKLLSNPEQCQQIRDQLPDIEERFGCRRFQQTIYEVVADELTTGRGYVDNGEGAH